jgi:(2Fe-2S) ferredoxin
MTDRITTPARGSLPGGRWRRLGDGWARAAGARDWLADTLRHAQIGMAGPEVNVGERQADDPPPFFEFHVFVCTNRRPDGHAKGSCAERGSEKLRDYMKARAKELGLSRARINAAGCLDRCESGPCVVVYPEGIWYHIGSTDDVDAVLQRHLMQGARAAQLMLPGR